MKHVSCVAVVVAVLSCAGTQPPTPCLVGRADVSPYAALATLKPGSAVTPECAAVLPASRVEILAVQKFNAPGTSQQDLAIEPAALVALDENGDPAVDPADPAHSQLAEGSLTAGVVDEAGLCTAPTLTEARQDFPTSSGGSVSVRYQFSNVRFLADAAHAGTQLGADLTYSEGDCTAGYDVIAVFPAVGCASDADCDPHPDPSAGRVSGSGINEDYPTHCDVDTGVCLLSGPFPQLQSPEPP